MTKLSSLLDNTAVRIVGDEDPLIVMGDLCDGLNQIRESVPVTEWSSRLKQVCLSHSLRTIVHQDPYTLRAFEKPRGYAGDGVMLDYVYFGVPPEETTEIGRRVFRASTRLSNGLSVIERRNYLAQLIDRTAKEAVAAQVLAVACGHLRESQVSEAVQSGTIGTFYALDQDAECLDVVKASNPGQENIVTVNASVKDLLRGSAGFKNVSLIYALGLFDYLTDAVARRLAANLFSMLAPGGRLVLAAFTPDSQGRGYMEAFMDWFLVYRDEAGLQACANDIPSDAVAERHAFRDNYGNIAFVELVRAS